MRLHSFTVGGGTAGTVLLHGFLGSGKNLRTLAQRWSERAPDRRFLLPDLAGHGQSPPVGEPAQLADLAQDVLETARATGLQGPLDWVGHSLGGRVALAACQAAPADVASVVMLDIAPGPIDTATSDSGRVLDILAAAPARAPDRRDLRGFLVERGLSEPIADWLMMNVHRTQGEYVWRFDREALRRLHARVNREDLWPVAERAARGHRLWCIRGGRSPYVPDADLRRLEGLGARVDTLPGAGHFVHVTALDALVELLAAGV